MRRERNLFLIGIVVTVVIIGTAGLSAAETWNAYQFERAERYEYRVNWGESTEEEATYIIDIQEVEDDLFEVSYTTVSKLSRESLGQETAFGIWGTYGPALEAQFMWPMFGQMFEDMTLEVDEKAGGMLGMPTIVVVEKEEVGDREGFLCRVKEKSDDQEKLLFEIVVDPDLALPLRTTSFDNDEVEVEMTLIDYERY